MYVYHEAGHLRFVFHAPISVTYLHFERFPIFGLHFERYIHVMHFYLRRERIYPNFSDFFYWTA